MGKIRKGCTMPKIEITVTDDEKERLKVAAASQHLKLATWAKFHLLGLASIPQKGEVR
jgi:hypothetical protein